MRIANYRLAPDKPFVMKRVAIKALLLLLKTFVALVIIIALMLWGNQ
jgi:hypothetical protein